MRRSLVLPLLIVTSFIAFHSIGVVEGVACYHYSCWDESCDTEEPTMEICDAEAEACYQLRGKIEGGPNATRRASGGCWEGDPSRPNMKAGDCVESEFSDSHPQKGELLFTATECVCGDDLCNELKRKKLPLPGKGGKGGSSSAPSSSTHFITASNNGSESVAILLIAIASVAVLFFPSEC